VSVDPQVLMAIRLILAVAASEAARRAAAHRPTPSRKGCPMVDRAQPVTDPRVLEAILSELMLSVYRAQRRARLQALGQLPPPAPNPRAQGLMRQSPSH
jgi:hypothetical protein